MGLNAEPSFYDRFEQDLTDSLGVAMSKDEKVCVEVWSALVNMRWQHRTMPDDAILVSYSFRSAGALIADIISEGDYLDWYMSGPAGEVSPQVRGALAKFGWTPVPWAD